MANSGRPDAGAGHGGPQLDRDEHRMGNGLRSAWPLPSAAPSGRPVARSICGDGRGLGKGRGFRRWPLGLRRNVDPYQRTGSRGSPDTAPRK